MNSCWLNWRIGPVRAGTSRSYLPPGTDILSGAKLFVMIIGSLPCSCRFSFI